jgi:hypothetical protein
MRPALCREGKAFRAWGGLRRDFRWRKKERGGGEGAGSALRDVLAFDFRRWMAWGRCRRQHFTGCGHGFRATSDRRFENRRAGLDGCGKRLNGSSHHVGSGGLRLCGSDAQRSKDRDTFRRPPAGWRFR